MALEDTGFPEGTGDETELYLRWLAFLRGAVLRKAIGLTEDQARWHPDGKLIPLIGVVNHLTGVERRWVGGDDGKPADEYEPGPWLTMEAAIAAYRERAAATDEAVRASRPLTAELRFVLVHLINETARHAGHADATRELLDGKVGE